MTSTSAGLMGTALLVAIAGCAQVTPVRPAPLTAERVRDLRNTLVGDWKWVKDKHPDGRLKDQPAHVVFSFASNGAMRYQFAHTMFALDEQYRWELDGANIRTTHPGHPVLRADAWSENRLELFWYDRTLTLVLEKERR